MNASSVVPGPSGATGAPPPLSIEGRPPGGIIDIIEPRIPPPPWPSRGMKRGWSGFTLPPAAPAAPGAIEPMLGIVLPSLPLPPGIMPALPPAAAAAGS